MVVEVNNLIGAVAGVDKVFIKKIVEVVLKSEKKSNRDISIVLVDLDKMKTLNQQYRQKNRPTDVLTFPELDIVICPKVVKDNAKSAKLTFRAELARVVIHGVLHWLGYDHEAGQRKAREMQDKEEKYFKLKIKNEK